MASHVYDDINNFVDLQTAFTSTLYDDVTIVITDSFDIEDQLQPNAAITTMLLTSVEPESKYNSYAPPATNFDTSFDT